VLRLEHRAERRSSTAGLGHLGGRYFVPLNARGWPAVRRGGGGGAVRRSSGPASGNAAGAVDSRTVRTSASTSPSRAATSQRRSQAAHRRGFSASRRWSTARTGTLITAYPSAAFAAATRRWLTTASSWPSERTTPRSRADSLFEREGRRVWESLMGGRIRSLNQESGFPSDAGSGGRAMTSTGSPGAISPPSTVRM